jgi:hypothetical protein
VSELKLSAILSRKVASETGPTTLLDAVAAHSIRDIFAFTHPTAPMLRDQTTGLQTHTGGSDRVSLRPDRGSMRCPTVLVVRWN